MRTYRDDAQEIGHEKTPHEYIASLVHVCSLLYPKLKDTGVIWLNIGDSFAPKNYASHGMYPAIKKGEQMMIPAMLAIELRKIGYFIAQDVIWHKRNPMPNPTTRRCTPSHEYIWFISKNQQYTFDVKAIEEQAAYQPGLGESMPPIGGKKVSGGNNSVYTGRVIPSTGTRRKRDIWFETTSRCKEAHFAPFPESIVRPAIRATTQPGDVVLDPFSGTGTTGRVALEENRQFVGMELYPEYIQMSHDLFEKKNNKKKKSCTK
jgi:site-specific DNA-methyltransferase (cytosine-N4-specific)